MAGVMIGMIGTATLFNLIGSDSNQMFSMPWHWHFVLGGFALGMTSWQPTLCQLHSPTQVNGGTVR